MYLDIVTKVSCKPVYLSFFERQYLRNGFNVLLSLVLVIFVVFERGDSHSVANFRRQSNAFICSSDSLLDLAKMNRFSSGIPTAFLVL